MKSRNAILSFVGGLLLGIFLALGFGASGQNQPPVPPGPPGPPVKDWSRVTVFSYASGMTGVFDQTNGRLYVYDAGFDRCLFIRDFTVLGDPMRRIRN